MNMEKKTQGGKVAVIQIRGTINVSSDIKDTLTMLKGVQAVGNDLMFDGPVSAPHLLIAEMALSGT